MKSNDLPTPPFEGLTYRHPRSEDDLRPMYDLWMAYHQAEGVDFARTYEDHCKAYLNQSNFDLHQDVLLAEVGGELAAYVMTRWSNMPLEDAISFLINVYVSPTWQRKGLGAALLGWAEAKVAREAAGFPPDKAKYIRAYAHTTQEGKLTVLKQSGYRLIDEYAILIRPNLDDIPTVEPPEGITFHPLDVKDARKLWDAIQEAFRDHVDYDEPTEQGFINWQKAFYFQPERICVAWDGDEIVGQILNYINLEENTQYSRKRGYTEWISVRRPWRRRGIARAMLAHSLKIVKGAGMEEAALEVHVTNPHEAFALYREMGYQPHSSEYAFRKDLPSRG